MGRRPVTSTGVSVGPREYNVDHVLVLGLVLPKARWEAAHTCLVARRAVPPQSPPSKGSLLLPEGAACRLKTI